MLILCSLWLLAHHMNSSWLATLPFLIIHQPITHFAVFTTLTPTVRNWLAIYSSYKRPFKITFLSLFIACSTTLSVVTVCYRWEIAREFGELQGCQSASKFRSWTAPSREWRSQAATWCRVCMSLLLSLCIVLANIPSIILEMWASAQCDGRPAEYRWHPLFNAAVWLMPTTVQ